MIKGSLAQVEFLYMFTTYFPVQYFQYLIRLWSPLWQVTVLAKVKWQRKGKMQGCRSSPVSEEGSEPWVWSGCESRGRIERGAFKENEGDGHLAGLPGKLTLGKWWGEKNTYLKGRVSIWDRGWNKIEKKHSPELRAASYPLPSPSSRTLSFQGLMTFCSTFFPFTFHTDQCTYWFPHLFFPPESRLWAPPGQGLAFYKRLMNEWTRKEGNWILFEPVGQIRSLIIK